MAYVRGFGDPWSSGSVSENSLCIKVAQTSGGRRPIPTSPLLRMELIISSQSRSASFTALIFQKHAGKLTIKIWPDTSDDPTHFPAIGNVVTDTAIPR